jgi:Icc-related predicted phosphoesterase
MVKVIHTSDTHNVCPAIPEGDILIHSGDGTISSTTAELRNFASWMNSLPHKVKIYVPGNHDWELLNYRFDDYEKLFDDTVNLVTVGMVETMGLKIFGCAAPGGWGAVPAGVDILVTHYPPLGILDEIPAFSKFNNGPHAINIGSAKLLEQVQHRIKPRYHLFGHIHECGGQFEKLGDTTFINAAHMDEYYKPTNAPMIFNIDPLP